MDGVLDSIPMAREKAIGEMVALFKLGANPELVRLRDTVKGMLFGRLNYDEIQWESPDDYHITSVYMLSGTSLEGIQTLDYYNIPAFSVVIDGIGTFDTPDGYAVYARVRPQGEIRSVQNVVYDYMTAGGMQGIPSEFSLYPNYTPHITLCHSPIPIFSFDIEPFSLMVNRLEISDSERYPVFVRVLKSLEETQIEKAVQLEVIEKGVHYNEEGDLVIPVIGVPFKGPVNGKADLAGDWFHKGTNIGSEHVAVNAFYDHGRDGNYMVKELKALGLSEQEIKALGPDFGFGKHDIGVAQRGETTEDGIIFNIIVNRNTRYKKALEKAARLGYLQASGEFKPFEYDQTQKGKVDTAFVAGMVLSPTPYNIKAEVVKSVVMEGDEMATKKAEQENKEVEVEDAEVTEETDDGGSKTVNPITKAIQAKKAEQVEKATQEEEDAEEDEIASTVAELSEQVLGQSQVLKALDESFEGFKTDMQTALPELADMITKSVLEGLSEMIEDAVIRHVAKSKLELGNAVEKSVSKRSTGIAASKSVSKTTPIHGQAAAMANYPGSN